MYGLRTECYIYTVTFRHKEPLGEKPLSPPSTDTVMKGLAILGILTRGYADICQFSSQSVDHERK